MKILLISSSPRKEKSQTFLLAREVLKGCRLKTEPEIIHLCGHKIEFCRHYESCHKNIMRCPIKDDVEVIVKKMLSSDAIIFASPNYINHITASLKALLERATHFIHCKRLLDKYIAAVVTSGSGMDEDVLQYIKSYGLSCGAQYSGGVSSGAGISEEKLAEAARLGEKLISDIKDKKIYPDQMRLINESREHFKKVMEMRKDDWQEEYKFWKDKGWL